MKPRAGSAVFANATSLTHHRSGHLQGNDSPQVAPVVNHGSVTLRAGVLGQVVLFSGV